MAEPKPTLSDMTGYGQSGEEIAAAFADLSAHALRLESRGWHYCPDCNGAGRVEGDGLNRNGYYTVMIDCPTCRGEGVIDDEIGADE